LRFWKQHGNAEPLCDNQNPTPVGSANSSSATVSALSCGAGEDCVGARCIWVVRLDRWADLLCAFRDFADPAGETIAAIASACAGPTRSELNEHGDVVTNVDLPEFMASGGYALDGEARYSKRARASHRNLQS
jgi:hypothetical protein